MNKPGPALLVAVVDQTAFIKVPGRANFTTSHDFKALVQGLKDRHYHNFVLDLHECITMDSTFLGVMAGMVLKNGHVNSEGTAFELLNPNARVSDLLENLGVLDLFQVRNEDTPCTLVFEPALQMAPTREEVTRTCLNAHQTLMEINPDNIPKFKEVTEFMAEDLKKMGDGKNGS